MKTLVHFELEGLVRQGPETVWVPLGYFETPEEAHAASVVTRWGAQIEGSRVTPLFRDSSGGYGRIDEAVSEPSHRMQPHFNMANKEHRELPVTLA